MNVVQFPLRITEDEHAFNCAEARYFKREPAVVIDFTMRLLLWRLRRITNEAL